MTQSNLNESENRPIRFPSLPRRHTSNWLSRATILAAVADLDCRNERRKIHPYFANPDRPSTTLPQTPRIPFIKAENRRILSQPQEFATHCQSTCTELITSTAPQICGTLRELCPTLQPPAGEPQKTLSPRSAHQKEGHESGTTVELPQTA